MNNKFISKVLSNTKLYNIWYINNNNLAFNFNITVYDIKYEKIELNIDGYFPDGPFRKPIVIWKMNENPIYKPSPLSYHAGGEYDTSVGRWLDSTLVENNIENLFYSYILAEKYNVKHLISDKWDELFYLRSFFTKDGTWTPAIIRNSDSFIDKLKGEIYFFGELKYNIYKELQFFKNDNNSLSPIQKKFIYNYNVIALLKLINKFSDITDFELQLFEKIFSFIPNDNIYKKLWNLDIFKWNMTKDKLINHFLEFNKIKLLNLF
jgi:hypothetical protein